MTGQPQQQEPEVEGTVSGSRQLPQWAAEEAALVSSVGTPANTSWQPGQGNRTDTGTAVGAPAGNCPEPTWIRQQALQAAEDDAPAFDGGGGAAGACCALPPATTGGMEACSADNSSVRSQPAVSDVVGPTACGMSGDSNRAESPSTDDRAEAPQSPNAQLQAEAQHAAPGQSAPHHVGGSAAGALEAAALEQAMIMEQAIEMCKEFEAFAAPSRGLSSVAQALAAVVGAAEGAMAAGAALPPSLATAVIDASVSLLAAAAQWQASSASRG